MKEILDYFDGFPGPFRAYENPQRSDGVFVGQDRPIEPYPHHRLVNGVIWATSDKEIGKPLYPATPRSARMFPVQVPRDVAEKVIAILNERHGSAAPDHQLTTSK